MKKLLDLLNLVKKEAPTRTEVERRKFSEEVRGQFLKLREKGLSIPVFTL